MDSTEDSQKEMLMGEERFENLIVWAGAPEYEEEARRLAEHLGIPMKTEAEGEPGSGLILRLNEEGLTLVGGDLELRGDFTRMLPRLKPANLQREFLVKAAKLKGIEGVPLAVDATAGLGEDAILLAAAGFRVILFEYDPVIAALLADALHRGAKIPELADIVSRMELREGNSIEELPKLASGESGQEPVLPDVVVLDPMFPERQKSALVKKKFQLLHELEQPCSDEEALVRAAIAANPRKVVIKRPLKGPILAGIKPSYSLKGKAIRYDCLVYAR